MLHTISNSSTSIQSQINPQMILSTDVVLFWQNGVIAALKNSLLLEDILQQTAHCYILDSDIVTRGLINFIDKRIKIINIKQAVELTAQHFPQINWGE